MRIFGDFRGFSRVGGDNGVITHIYPPDGVFPHLTRAYPKDRVEGPAYHTSMPRCGVICGKPQIIGLLRELKM